MNEARLNERGLSFALAITTGPTVPQELAARLSDLGLSTLERYLDRDTAAVIEQHDPALLILLLDREQRPAGQLADILAHNRRPLVALVEGDRRAAQLLVTWLTAGADLAYFTTDYAGLVSGAIAAMLRRERGLERTPEVPGGPERPAVVEAADVRIDVSRHRVTRGGVEIPLTRMEFLVLQVLAERANHVCTITDIATAVYERPFVPSSSAESIRTCVSRLRRKIEDDPLHPRLIRSARGFGYVFRTEPAGEPGGEPEARPQHDETSTSPSAPAQAE